MKTCDIEKICAEIARMESIFDRLSFACRHFPAAVKREKELVKMLSELTEYYEGGAWLHAYEADEKGLLPRDLKRGVLSEDGVYNLLSDISTQTGNLLRIAFIQVKAEKDPAKNLEKAKKLCTTAKEKGADIALFPEMFSCGYDIYDRATEAWTGDAISPNDPFIRAFSALAAELDMAICITYLEKTDAAPKNSLAVFDRSGRSVLDYSKVHTCDFGEEKHLAPGEDFYVSELDTKLGPVKIGAMICYDREFPESARILMLKGAELILVPNACPMEINRLSQLRGRAYENMVAIATCNYPETVPDCNGHSSLFDGVVYLPCLSGSRDTCVFEADGSEGVFTADLDLDMLRFYRKTEVHGNTYRRPEKYGIICSEITESPFIRSDKRK